ncbi:MAG: quinone-dependent dihydroorotate dehydrogenase [Oscillatoriales cyanobacterium RM2_1_1]|nr:quinone-dependent dihydroorotate dehydrogenase [Oscillatoriales cyanobacterium RM2_1_1]
MDIYREGIRPILFSGLDVDPEWAHHRVLQLLSWLEPKASEEQSKQMIQAWTASLRLRDSRLQQTLWGLNFDNPLGLAAGFDKDGVAAGLWGTLGFGFAELGTVTRHPQPGNPPPRLFRLVEDEAILNRMGFNNQGADALAQRLVRKSTAIQYPIGINLGKSKITPLESAAIDYLQSFQILQDWGDYFVVNVSSPNTPGLRSLQDIDQLSKILQAIDQTNQHHKPLLVKIAPDLTDGAILEILNLAQEYHLAGIIATNTTINRQGLKTQVIKKTCQPVTAEPGGISGAPLKQRSTEVIQLIWQQTQGQLPIIGVGGIFTAADAWEKITAGASLIQIYTGWVYEGPWMVKRILQGLLQKLEENGLPGISAAVGSAHR